MLHSIEVGSFSLSVIPQQATNLCVPIAGSLLLVHTLAVYKLLENLFHLFNYPPTDGCLG